GGAQDLRSGAALGALPALADSGAGGGGGAAQRADAHQRGGRFPARSNPAPLRAHGAGRGNAASDRDGHRNVVASARAAERQAVAVPLRLSRAVQRCAGAAGALRAVVRETRGGVPAVAGIRAEGEGLRGGSGAAAAPPQKAEELNG